MTDWIARKAYSPYIPKTFSEIWDQLGSMALGGPSFVDKTGYFPDRNIDTEFFALTEGFKLIRRKLGEERYAQLVTLADRTKAHFLADPEDQTEESMAGRRLLAQMEDVLRDAVTSKKLGKASRSVDSSSE